MPLEGIDFFVRYMELPPKIFAYVRSNGDSTFSVYIDPRRSCDQQINDYAHEIKHIVNDDLFTSRPVWVIEREM